MPYITPQANDLFQVKGECLVTYRTDKTINVTYRKGQTIRFLGVAPFTAKFSYKGLDYLITGTTIANFIANCKFKLQLYMDYNISDMTNNYVRFTKKDMRDIDIVFVEDNISVTDITDVISEKDKNFSVRLSIFENVLDNRLAVFHKAVNEQGDATFSIADVLREELKGSFLFSYGYFERRMNFMLKFSLIASTMCSENDMTKIDIYAINANLNVDDTAKVMERKFLTNCLNKEFTLLSNNKLYVVFTENTSINIEVFLNNSTSVEITLPHEGLGINCIYELNSNWKYIKTLFPAIDETKVIKYTITHNGSGDVATFNITKQEKREFIFVNRFGVFETILFKNNDQREINIETERILSNSNVIFESKKVASHKRIINTGFIYSDFRRSELTDLFCSEKVYEVVGEKLVPIYIENNNVAIKLLDKMQVHNIEINYYYTENQKIL